jgi:hypothetical protein
LRIKVREQKRAGDERRKEKDKQNIKRKPGKEKEKRRKDNKRCHPRHQVY